jgi:hypothetical protein
LPTDCSKVHSRKQVLSTVLRDTLRECAADIRRTNPACTNIDRLATLDGYYTTAADECIARGKVAGLPGAAERSAIRDDIANTSLQIDKEFQ